MEKMLLFLVLQSQDLAARLRKLVNDVQVFPMRLVDDDAQQLCSNGIF